MGIPSDPLRVFPTPERIRKLFSLLEEFLSSPEQPVTSWRSLISMMSSLASLVQGARLRARSLQFRLRFLRALSDGSRLLRWGDSCQGDLLWWSDLDSLTPRVPLESPLPELSLFTDPSDVGWGEYLDDDRLPACGLPSNVSIP